MEQSCQRLSRLLRLVLLWVIANPVNDRSSAKRPHRCQLGCTGEVFVISRTVRQGIDVDFFVSPKVTRFCEPLVADIALKWLFSSMPSHVNFQCARPHETLITLLALERSLSSMPPKVIAEMAMSCERSVTAIECALKGSLTVMDPLVCLKVALFCESLIAAWEIANEWFFSSMSAFMDFETAGA